MEEKNCITMINLTGKPLSLRIGISYFQFCTTSPRQLPRLYHNLRFDQQLKQMSKVQVIALQYLKSIPGFLSGVFTMSVTLHSYAYIQLRNSITEHASSEKKHHKIFKEKSLSRNQQVRKKNLALFPPQRLL